MVILKYIEILNHYVVYEELVLFEVNYTSKTNKFIGKEITFVVTRSRVWREEELDEGRQKV